MRKVSVIIPAHNEEERIGNVLDVVKKSLLINSIYVVDDGSTDNTSQVAESYNVNVLRLPENKGKGFAVLYGVKNTESDVILMLDADLINLKEEHIENLLNPVLQDNADMTIGIFSNGRFSTDLAQMISPFLSGQRAIKRWIFDEIDIEQVNQAGYAIEIILTNIAKKLELRVMEVDLPNVSHVMKEEKMGFIKGSQARMKMYKDIFKGLIISKQK
ncbi:glycosyltransferase family 2 protein [Caldicellulosiruptoraceae bacterium PP1]